VNNQERINLLNNEKSLPHEEWVSLLSGWDDSDRKYAAAIARKITQQRFGKVIYIRGIIEFSNFCRNDCLYCGIRHSNHNAERYRLTKEEILECCNAGYRLGLRTFVLQSGEDTYFTAKRTADIVFAIKKVHPDCAVTLSIGELSHKSYQILFDAGTDRYLLRHETADESHYRRLHPPQLSWSNRIRCLYDLKEIGFQTGCGFMVGSPYQTSECFAKDMEFIYKFKPHMIGIGPFIPHKDTPFVSKPAGTLEMTLFLLSLCRIMHPNVLLPATTALGTINPHGREMGVLAGANVIMPNISPKEVQNKYLLYNNKNSADPKANVIRSELQKRMESIGYSIMITRGDYAER
jgi:biotin synthase